MSRAPNLPMSAPDDPEPRSDAALLDLALCLILAFTTVGLLLLAL